MKTETDVLSLLKEIKDLFEADRIWDGNRYSYALKFPHIYLSTLEKVNQQITILESEEDDWR